MGSKFLRVLVFWSAPANSASRPRTVSRRRSKSRRHLCFRNIGAVLEHAGLSFKDIVRINAFVVSREHLKGYMSVRDLYVTDPAPASTLMIVSGFSRPEFLVEVEVMAAGP